LALAFIPASIARGIPAANRPTKSPIMETTTSNSTKVKADVGAVLRKAGRFI